MAYRAETRWDVKVAVLNGERHATDVDFFIALKSDRLFPIIHTPIVTNKQIKVRVSQREPVPQMLPG